MATTAPANIVSRQAAASHRIGADHDFHLSISVGLPSVHLALLDKSTKRYDLLNSFHLSRFITPDRFEAVADEIFSSIAEHKPVISSVSCHFTSACQTLIPKALYQADEERNLLSISAELPDHWLTKTDAVNSGAIVNIFGIPSSLEKAIVGAFPTASIVHSSTVVIESALIHQRNDTKKKVLATFDGNFIHIVVSEGSKVEFYNQYLCESEGDAAYYIMLAMELTQLLPGQRNLILLGAHDSKQACIEQLRPYVDQLQQDWPGNFTCAPELPLHAGADHFLLLNQYLCA